MAEERDISLDQDELLESLLVLRQWLQNAGFDPGLQRIQTSLELLLRLAADGQISSRRPGWEKWLAPVLSSSKEEQDHFSKIFSEWARQFPGPEKGRPREHEDSRPSTIRPVSDATRLWSRPLSAFNALIGTLRRRLWKAIIVTSAIFAITTAVAGLIYWFSQPVTVRVFGQVVAEGSSEPLTNALVSTGGDGDVRTDEKGYFDIRFDRSRFKLTLFEWLNRQSSITASIDGYEPQSKTYLPIRSRVIFPVAISLKDNGTGSKRAETPLNPVAPLPPIDVDGMKYSPIQVRTGDPEAAQGYLWINIIISILPLLAWILWAIVAAYLRRAYFEKRPDRGLPRLEELKVEGLQNLVFASQLERRMMVELRRQRPISIDNLNIPLSVRATIRSGSFIPIYEKRRQTPEYLLLIDRESARDGQARLAEELFYRLKENGVYAIAYYFQRDARMCQSLTSEDEPPVSLQNLGARFSDYRLIVFSDAAGFFDPFYGRAHRWLNYFSQWEYRAILTPEPVHRWSHREERLAELDFIVLPVGVDGLRGLAQWFNDQTMPQTEQMIDQPFPPLIEQRPNRWIERLEPSTAESTQLLAELEQYLGPRNWKWLCACAVYPEVTWDLTLFLGYTLFGDDVEWQSDWAVSSLRLVRLPWYRIGSMPEWLRHLLVERLDYREARKVRLEIHRLLRTANQEMKSHISLSYAVPEKAGWLARWNDRWRALLVYLKIREEEESEALQDYVFLRFMTGRSLNQLALKLPERLRKILYRKGRPLLGLRPVVSLGLILATVLVIRLVLPWSGAIEQPRDKMFRYVTGRDGLEIDLDGPGQIRMAIIPGGGYLMGSEKGEEDELPVHRVDLNPFYIGRTEITQAEWEAVMGTLPEVGFVGYDRPVESVSWDDAHQFCRRLSERTGLEVRLPTEAEWEYATRAGTTTKYSFGDDQKLLADYGWYSGNSGDETLPVARKRPNRFGLYDVHGNVWEWCEDRWHDNYEGAPSDGRAWESGDSEYRVVRGGSWGSYSNGCRSAGRDRNPPGFRSDAVGLRIVIGARTSGT